MHHVGRVSHIYVFTLCVTVPHNTFSNPLNALVHAGMAHELPFVDEEDLPFDQDPSCSEAVR